MQIARLHELEVEEVWSEQDDSIRHAAAYPTFWGTGSQGSSVVYFELEPQRRLGRHTHSAEEVVLAVEGTVEVTVGDETETLTAPALAVVPPLAPHDVRNAGEGTARCAGVMASAAVVTVFEQELMPGGSRVQGTPAPESVLDEG